MEAHILDIRGLGIGVARESFLWLVYKKTYLSIGQVFPYDVGNTAEARKFRILKTSSKVATGYAPPGRRKPGSEERRGSIAGPLATESIRERGW
jgi:hypothetical protein